MAALLRTLACCLAALAFLPLSAASDSVGEGLTGAVSEAKGANRLSGEAAIVNFALGYAVPWMSWGLPPAIVMLRGDPVLHVVDKELSLPAKPINLGKCHTSSKTTLHVNNLTGLSGLHFDSIQLLSEKHEKLSHVEANTIVKFSFTRALTVNILAEGAAVCDKVQVIGEDFIVNVSIVKPQISMETFYVLGVPTGIENATIRDVNFTYDRIVADCWTGQDRETFALCRDMTVKNGAAIKGLVSGEVAKTMQRELQAAFNKVLPARPPKSLGFEAAQTKQAAGPEASNDEAGKQRANGGDRRLLEMGQVWV